jgi:hypothetical protein
MVPQALNVVAGQVEHRAEVLDRGEPIVSLTTLAPAR